RNAIAKLELAKRAKLSLAKAA
ncbi:MAG: hypothetical protein RJA39_289, partial [Pseudomonadota bacterium]